MATPRRTAGADAVKVVGLKELQASLRTLDEGLPKQLRAANKRVAEKVAERARARASALGGVAEHVAPSIKAAAEQRYAKLALGGPKYPMALGANFGALHNVERQTSTGRTVIGWNQFKARVEPDAFLYATIRAERTSSLHDYLDELDQLIRSAGLK